METKPSATCQTDSNMSRPLPTKGTDSSSPDPAAAPINAVMAASAAFIRPCPREARSAMGLPLSATITLSRSMNSITPAAMPPPPPGAGNAAAPLAAAENSMGW